LQWCDACPCAEREGSGGYLRILEFTPAAIRVTTYSPHLDHWLHDGDTEFELLLE
jgi:hypothetical protein